MNREELLGLLVSNLKKAVPEFAGEDLDTSRPTRNSASAASNSWRW